MPFHPAAINIIAWVVTDLRPPIIIPYIHLETTIGYHLQFDRLIKIRAVKQNVLHCVKKTILL